MKRVKFPGNATKIGEIVQVEISKALEWIMYGKEKTTVQFGGYLERANLRVLRRVGTIFVVPITGCCGVAMNTNIPFRSSSPLECEKQLSGEQHVQKK